MTQLITTNDSPNILLDSDGPRMIDFITLGQTMGLIVSVDTGPFAVGTSVRMDFGGAESNPAIGVSLLGHNASCKFMQDEQMYWSQLHAAGTLIMAPILLFSLLAQRRIVSGIVGGVGK